MLHFVSLFVIRPLTLYYVLPTSQVMTHVFDIISHISERSEDHPGVGQEACSAHSMQSFPTYVHDLLFDGSLRRGGEWGGEECAAYVPIHMHIIETTAWLTILLMSGLYLDVPGSIIRLKSKARELLKRSPTSPLQRILEIAVAILLFSMFAMLVIIKFNDKAMINLTQPCHLLLILQGIALLSTGPEGSVITIFILPPLAGVLTAMVIPAVDGLSSIEIINFWVQHVLLGVLPIYLLCRQQFTVSRLCSIHLFAIGLWIFAMFHFTFYEVVCVSFNVNPQFMLCPTFGLRPALAALPEILLFPTYRTTVTFIFSAMALINSYLYYTISFLLDVSLSPFLEPSHDSNHKKNE